MLILWLKSLVPFLISSVVIAIILAFFQLLFGKDERPEVIKVEYDLPSDIPPAVAGTIVDEKADVVDVIATVFDLERRGYLQIKPVERHRYFYDQMDVSLNQPKKELEITVINGDIRKLRDFEQEVMNFILERESAGTKVYLSDFGEKFVSGINYLRRKIEDEAAKMGYFYGAPYNVRNFFTALYFLLWGIGDIVIFKFCDIRFFDQRTMNNLIFYPNKQLLYYTLLVVYALLPLILVYPIYKRLKYSVALRTKKGVKAWGRILGFKEFIKRVEKEKIKRMAEKDPQIFVKVLPYAIILGVAKEWASKMEKGFVEFPDWWKALNPMERSLLIGSNLTLNKEGWIDSSGY